MEPNLCVIFPPPVADYMSAVYQDVIEGYLIASVKVCSSTSNEIQWTHWNFIWNVQPNETLCSACWLVHLWQFADTQGSVLELSWRQWTGPTRWVQQCQMGSECGGTSTFFLQCWCIWPLTILTLSIYFQSWPSPMCILENHQFLFCRHCNLFNLQSRPHFALGCQITPITSRLSEMFGTWGKKVYDCKYLEEK